MKNSYVYNIFIILLYKLQYTTLWQIDCKPPIKYPLSLYL